MAIRTRITTSGVEFDDEEAERELSIGIEGDKLAVEVWFKLHDRYDNRDDWYSRGMELDVEHVEDLVLAGTAFLERRKREAA